MPFRGITRTVINPERSDSPTKPNKLFEKIEYHSFKDPDRPLCANQHPGYLVLRSNSLSQEPKTYNCGSHLRSKTLSKQSPTVSPYPITSCTSLHPSPRSHRGCAHPHNSSNPSTFPPRIPSRPHVDIMQALHQRLPFRSAHSARPANVSSCTAFTQLMSRQLNTLFATAASTYSI